MFYSVMSLMEGESSPYQFTPLARTTHSTDHLYLQATHFTKLARRSRSPSGRHTSAVQPSLSRRALSSIASSLCRTGVSSFRPSVSVSPERNEGATGLPSLITSVYLQDGTPTSLPRTTSPTIPLARWRRSTLIKLTNRRLLALHRVYCLHGRRLPWPYPPHGKGCDSCWCVSCTFVALEHSRLVSI